MRMDKFTARLQEALGEAQSLAVGQSHSAIEPVHLLLALLQQSGGVAAPLLEKAGANPADVITALKMAMDKLPTVGQFNGDVQLSQGLARLLNLADREAQQRGDQYVSTEALLLAACDDGGELGKLFKNAGIKKKVLAETLTLEVQDVGEILPVTQSMPIPIAGEAYKIEVDVKFPEEGFNGIDFGTVKVVDDDVKTISIVNTGKYEIGYQFNVRRQWVSDLFEITPKEGRIPPGGKSPTTITLHFNKERQLKKEITLNGANDITMSIIEVATDLTEETVPMKTSVRAVFNKYSITPARGIVFGPHTYNTLSNPRTFTITNHGEFDFDFKLFKFSDGLVKKESSTGSAAAAPAKGGKGGKGSRRR